jgi:hypothetical protein
LSDSIRIRPADRTDVPRLFSLIAELAEYERAPDKVAGNEELLEAALLGAQRLGEWQTLRLDGPALQLVARGSDQDR